MQIAYIFNDFKGLENSIQKVCIQIGKHTYCDLALQSFNDNQNDAMENMQNQRNKKNTCNNNSNLKVNAYVCFI